MHTNSRPDADLMQNKSMNCRMLADSMHTLRRANQCHSNAAAGPLGPAGGGWCAMPRRFPRAGKAAAREGEAAAREGKAAAREGEAAAREGEAAARESEAVAREGEAATREGKFWAR